MTRTADSHTRLARRNKAALTPATPDSASPAQALQPRTPALLRTINLLAVTLPLLGFVATAIALWGWGFNATHLAVFGVMYVLTGLGVTVGYHRLFTHRAFDAVAPLKITLAILGSMAVEGPLLRWVAQHRLHHQHSDTDDDIHSPNHHGDGLRGMLSGLWHAHVGWLFHPDPRDMSRYVGDLRKDQSLRRVSRLFPLWVLLGLLIPTALGGLLTWSWTGALIGLLWGGLARIFLVHHITWSINSVCHLWGSRPYETHDLSRNNVVFGIMGFGEGWHNNHHAFPNSARHGLAWWQLDFSYIVIRFFALLGLAHNVKVPERLAMDAKLRH